MSYPNFAAKYTTTGLEATILAASPHKLVSLQFAEVRKQIQIAVVLIGDGDIKGKGKAIGKAVDIVGNLDASLDHAAGGELAQQLHGLYEYMIVGLTNANLQNDVRKLKDLDALLEPIETAWNQAGTAS